MKKKTYRKIKQIGKGAYATVFLADDGESEAKYALKEIDLKICEGVPYSAIREIILLKELNHPNILRLLDVIHGTNTITLALDYMETDLQNVIKNTNSGLSSNVTKNYLYQILKGVSFMHKKHILHRDLKPQNILITKDKILKIADFGLGRGYNLPINGFTSYVITMSYRAPELLLGSQYYGSAVDMWSIGCIFAEMIRGQILFAGSNETSNKDQVEKIFRVRGTPNIEEYPDLENLINYGEGALKTKLNKFPKDDLKKYVPKLSEDGIDLLDKMLQVNPDKRISAQEALNHPYFNNLDEKLKDLYNNVKD